MGQVIAFPQRRRRITPQRMAAARNTVNQLFYLLGFFLLIPMAGLMALKYVAVSQPVGVVACLGLMVVAARLTLAALGRAPVEAQRCLGGANRRPRHQALGRYRRLCASRLHVGGEAHAG